jgi:proline iminopeptidase
VQIRIKSAEIHVETLGHGRRILTMHGGLGLDHATLRPWLDPLAEHGELVYFDQRGCGRSLSDGSDDDVDHSVWAEDVSHLNEAMGSEKAIVIAHSYGAFIALELAVRKPAWLAGLVLTSAAAAVDYPGTIMANASARGNPEALAALQRTLGAPPETDDEFRALFTSYFPLYFHKPDPAVMASALRDVNFRAAALRASVGKSLPRYDVRGQLSNIDVPTLILTGRHDFITPVEEAAMPLHRGIDGSELVIFEESGHYPFIEEHARYLDVVRTWLDRHK